MDNEAKQNYISIIDSLSQAINLAEDELGYDSLVVHHISEAIDKINQLMYSDQRI